MSFWDELKADADQIRADFAEAWEAAGSGPITKEQALRTLALMWKRSHLDILEHMPRYKSYFPTKMGYKGRLANRGSLWWVDHATAGVNGWGTLGWFSSMKRTHSKKFRDEAKAQAYAKRRGGEVIAKDGRFIVTWKGYSNAVTHFVVFNDGTPFYIVNIDNGCWGEPKRNNDAIQVEMVNPMVVHRKGTQWRFWAGPLPQKLLASQAPVELDTPFRGARHMLPYTWEQVITDIKLKRLCIAATMTSKPGDVEMTPRMAPDRMSQHTDWRTTKFDMGPLWPFDLCNQAAFENIPVEEYDFMKQFVRAEGADLAVDLHEWVEGMAKRAADPDTDHECDRDGDETIDSALEIQNALIAIYGQWVLPKFGADGWLGSETTAATKRFQNDWNRNFTGDRLKVDGVPGTQTCARLEKALEMGDNFQRI